MPRRKKGKELAQKKLAQEKLAYEKLGLLNTQEEQVNVWERFSMALKKKRDDELREIEERTRDIPLMSESERESHVRGIVEHMQKVNKKITESRNMRRKFKKEWKEWCLEMMGIFPAVFIDITGLKSSDESGWILGKFASIDGEIGDRNATFTIKIHENHIDPHPSSKKKGFKDICVKGKFGRDVIPCFHIAHMLRFKHYKLPSEDLTRKLELATDVYDTSLCHFYEFDIQEEGQHAGTYQHCKHGRGCEDITFWHLGNFCHIYYDKKKKK